MINSPYLYIMIETTTNLNTLNYLLDGNKLPNTLEFPISENKVSIEFEMHLDSPKIELVFGDESYVEIPFDNDEELIFAIGFNMCDDNGIYEDGVLIDNLDQFTWTDYEQDVKNFLSNSGIIN